MVKDESGVQMSCACRTVTLAPHSHLGRRHRRARRPLGEGSIAGGDGQPGADSPRALPRDRRLPPSEGCRLTRRGGGAVTRWMHRCLKEIA